MAPTADDDKNAQPNLMGKALNLVRNWRMVVSAATRAAANTNEPTGDPKDWSHSRLLSAFKHVSDDRDRLQVERDEAIARSQTDPLTGLSNRAGFRFGVEKMIGAALRAHDNPAHANNAIVIGYLDLDNFKQLNDTKGHAAGDTQLIEFGRRLKGEVRSSDYTARLGGDEFTFGMQTDNANQAIDHMRMFQMKLENERARDLNDKVPVGSLGFGVLDHAKIDDLIAKARKEAGNSQITARDIDPSAVFDAILSEADAGMYHNKMARRAARSALARTTAPSGPANAA